VAADRGTARRIFFDADALIAGSASTTGASHVLLVLGELGLLDVVVSQQVLAEAERNIQKKLPQALSAFRALIDAACTVVEDPRTSALRKCEGQAHPKDAPILGAAFESNCESLITFNTRHYRPRSEMIKIETPGRFLGRLRDELEQLSE
jgi:predicted nucleic acid-binding protein